MLSPLEKARLAFYEKQYGVFSSSQECLALALADEEIERACGPFDPCVCRFAAQKEAMFNMSLLYEKQNCSVKGGM